MLPEHLLNQRAYVCIQIIQKDYEKLFYELSQFP